MEKDKLSKIELEFAEARKEIMSLRLENRKLETAITLLSKPMVMSDSENEEEDQGNRKKARNSGAIVVALPQGESQARIDSLLAENTKLAAEIVELRQIVLETATVPELTPRKSSNRTLRAQPSTSGVASIFEKNKELELQLRTAEERINEIEAVHASAVRALNAKQEKEIRKVKYEKKYDTRMVYAIECLVVK